MKEEKQKYLRTKLFSAVDLWKKEKIPETVIEFQFW